MERAVRLGAGIRHREQAVKISLPGGLEDDGIRLLQTLRRASAVGLSGIAVDEARIDAIDDWLPDYSMGWMVPSVSHSPKYNNCINYKTLTASLVFPS